MSLSKVCYENGRFKLVFTKMLVFTAKTGSINSGTVKTRAPLWPTNEQRAAIIVNKTCRGM
jgi:hypothetical protein